MDGQTKMKTIFDIYNIYTQNINNDRVGAETFDIVFYSLLTYYVEVNIFQEYAIA